MKTVIEIRAELRPCIHRFSGELLLFHRWDSYDNMVCEKESGEIIICDSSSIIFTDNKHKEYDFTYKPTEKGGVEE